MGGLRDRRDSMGSFESGYIKTMPEKLMGVDPACLLGRYSDVISGVNVAIATTNEEIRRHNAAAVRRNTGIDERNAARVMAKGEDAYREEKWRPFAEINAEAANVIDKEEQVLSAMEQAFEIFEEDGTAAWMESQEAAGITFLPMLVPTGSSAIVEAAMRAGGVYCGGGHGFLGRWEADLYGGRSGMRLVFMPNRQNVEEGTTAEHRALLEEERSRAGSVEDASVLDGVMYYNSRVGTSDDDFVYLRQNEFKPCSSNDGHEYVPAFMAFGSCVRTDWSAVDERYSGRWVAAVEFEWRDGKLVPIERRQNAA